MLNEGLEWLSCFSGDIPGGPALPHGYPSLVRIYTKKGDDGSTGLLYGSRVSKADPAAEAYGTVDETVAVLGLARALSKDQALEELLLSIQRDLFVLGADLATNPEKRSKLEAGVSLVTAGMVDRLEGVIDQQVEEHALPQEFIVPGANTLSAFLDVGRALARRSERRTVELRETGAEVNADALRYLNRLSDLLFVLARAAAGSEEKRSRA
jgi:cob(I)alamin adenosyltransferase